MKSKQVFIKNTVMLTAVTLGLRAVSVSFQVYIANKIGAVGLGLFSLVMAVYNFGVTFACSGISLSTTKIVAEELAVASDSGAKKAVQVSVGYSLFFGTVAFCFIFFGADFFGNRFLNDARTVMPLKILSLSLPFVAMSSAAGGYFTAVGKVYKGALAQISEQLIRVAGGVFLLSVWGKNPEQACCAVVASGTVAECISFLFIAVLLVFDLKQRRIAAKPVAGITKRVLYVALPIAVSSYVRSALTTVEHTFIPKGLKQYGGDTEQALASYGLVHGMVMPIIFFPSAVLSAVSTLLIPEVTKFHTRKDEKGLNRFIETSLFCTMMFSVGAAGILYFFAEEIGLAVYGSKEAAHLLKVLAPLAVVMYADGVVDAVLKGLNQQVYSMAYNIFDSALAIVLMVFLLPTKGLYGYLLILYITEMVNAAFSINRLLKVSTFRVRPFLWTVFPVFAICTVTFFVHSIGMIGGIGAPVVVGILYFLVVYLFHPKISGCKIPLSMVK